MPALPDLPTSIYIPIKPKDFKPTNLSKQVKFSSYKPICTEKHRHLPADSTSQDLCQLKSSVPGVLSLFFPSHVCDLDVAFSPTIYSSPRSSVR